MATHDFSFSGGKILSRMGATWFVSYAYYETIDKFHMDWKKVSTVQSRISKYHSGKEYHKVWLNEVLAMNPANLSKNTIGLDAQQVKMMAREILEHWSTPSIYDNEIVPASLAPIYAPVMELVDMRDLGAVTLVKEF